MTLDPVVTIEHVRKAKLCTRGAREWAKVNGLDYVHFLNHGYPASVLEATGDALVSKVVEIARNEVNANG